MDSELNAPRVPTYKILHPRSGGEGVRAEPRPAPRPADKPRVESRTAPLRGLSIERNRREAGWIGQTRSSLSHWDPRVEQPLCALCYRVYRVKTLFTPLGIWYG